MNIICTVLWSISSVQFSSSQREGSGVERREREKARKYTSKRMVVKEARWMERR